MTSQMDILKIISLSYVNVNSNVPLKWNEFFLQKPKVLDYVTKSVLFLMFKRQWAIRNV